MRELLTRLCSVSGVSSREDSVRELIRGEAEPYCDHLFVDPLGSLIVHKKGRSGGKKLLTAHMDECGVMVSDFTEEGFVRFQTVGGIDCRTVVGKQVFLGTQRIPGVVGMKPIHLSTKEERKHGPKEKELYIDIGAASKKEAESALEKGDVGFFAVESGPFGDGLWKGRALDSRLPCAVLLALVREELNVDCTFVFAAQAQVGSRGAFAAAFRERPDAAICLFGTDSRDLWYLSKEQQEAGLGCGVVIPASDPGAMYERGMFESLRSCAEENAIPWQLQARAQAPSDAKAFQHAGVAAAGLAVPVRNLNAPAQLASLVDTQAMLNLCRAFLGQEVIE